MGVALREIIVKKEIEIKDLKNKIIVIDGFNILYQFLTTIRGPDGSPLTNSKGRVTSHLIGLFSRLIKFLEAEIKIVFVFDGITPELKHKERERRNKIKEEAEAKYQIAVKEEDIDSMKKYAARTSKLTSEMLEDSKKLITLMGIPIVQAPSEGEAQASYMVKNGDAYACVSQDYDSLLFNCPLVIHNLTIAGKRKKIHGIGTKIVKPETVNLKENLETLGITHDDLIILAMMIGTDYNIGGIKGIGPKTALKLVKNSKDYDAIFQNLKWNEFFNYDWREVFALFKDYKVTNNYKLKWNTINKEELTKFLIEELDFSEERVNNSLALINTKKQEQKGLGDYFK